MPYITIDRRKAVLHDPRDWPKTSGELNFYITTRALQPLDFPDEYFQRLITDVIQHYWQDTTRYQTANDIVGAIECAVMELQRRGVGEFVASRSAILLRLKREFYFALVGPYEDTAIARNGDLEFYLKQKEVK